jgi:hypothetical protein
MGESSPSIRDELREALAGVVSREAHQAQLVGESDLLRPFPEKRLNDFLRLARNGIEHLQRRSGADRVVRDRESDALREAVIGDFVSRSLAKRATHVE